MGKETNCLSASAEKVTDFVIARSALIMFYMLLEN